MHYEAARKNPADALARFRNDVEGHEMQVVRDDGVFRRLVFANPDSHHRRSTVTAP